MNRHLVQDSIFLVHALIITYSESTVFTFVHPISQLCAIVLGCYKRILAKLARIWLPFAAHFHTPILFQPLQYWGLEKGYRAGGEAIMPPPPHLKSVSVSTSKSLIFYHTVQVNKN